VRGVEFFRMEGAKHGEFGVPLFLTSNHSIGRSNLERTQMEYCKRSSHLVGKFG